MVDLISVIIPVYNVEKYLDYCIRSVQNQTYKNLEIILIDDKSTDNSNKMCYDYISDPRVIIVHGQNKGLSGARNSGLDVAKGKYVVFIDSDDYVECTMIENLHRCLIETGADTVIGGFRRKIGNHIEIRSNPFSGIVYDNTKDIKEKVLKKMLGFDGTDYIEMSVWRVLFSMEIIRNNHLRFPDRKYLSEDIIFDFDYYPLSKKLAMSEDTGYCYCFNEKSLCNEYQPNKVDRIGFQADEMQKKADELGFDENAKIRIHYYYVGNMLHQIKTIVANIKKTGRDGCIENCRSICNLGQVRETNWDKIEQCFKGRDKISYTLFKKNKSKLLYYYMRILTEVRSVIRG